MSTNAIPTFFENGNEDVLSKLFPDKKKFIAHDLKTIKEKKPQLTEKMIYQELYHKYSNSSSASSGKNPKPFRNAQEESSPCQKDSYEKPKTKKLPALPSEIHMGARDVSFKDMLSKAFEGVKLKVKYKDLLLTEKSLGIFDHVFTSFTANTGFDYEFYEQLGDSVLTQFIVFYSYKRFPQLKQKTGVHVVALIRHKYVSKDVLPVIAEGLGFLPFISASFDSLKKKEKLLEDVFEAFIGAVTSILDEEIRHGVGYAVAYDLLSSIYDKIDISLAYENLKDPVTRLKEIFDVEAYQPTIGNRVFYVENFFEDHNMYEFTVYYQEHGIRNNRKTIGYARNVLRDAAKRQAAEKGIVHMNGLGFVKKESKGFFADKC